MTQFETKMAEHNLAYSSLSNSIKKSVDEFYDAVGELNQQTEELEYADEETKLELDSNLQEAKDAIEELDTRLALKIEDYALKLPYYKEKMKHMHEKKAEKRALASQANDSNINTTTALASTPQMIIPTSAPSGDAVKVNSGNKSVGKWVMWGLLGLVSVAVGVNLMKNKS